MIYRLTSQPGWFGDGYTRSIKTRTTGSSTELPFPNCGKSASAELLKEYYRPQSDIPGIIRKVSVAATPDVYAQQ